MSVLWGRVCVSDIDRFIYTLMIALDANFRLKRRMVSNNLRDPALGSGQGYFVEDEAYREHVLKYANQKDMSATVKIPFALLILP